MKILKYCLNTLPEDTLKLKSKYIKIDDKETKYKIFSNGIIAIENDDGNLQPICHKIDKDGFHIVDIYFNGESKKIFVHKVLAELFLDFDKSSKDSLINFKDGNKDNLEISNLEIVKVDDKPTQASESYNQYNTKYTDEQIQQVCKLLEESKETLKDISKITGVPISTIWDIKNGVSWKNISNKYDIYKYKVQDQKGATGEANAFATITNAIVENICKDIESNKISLKNIALKYNVSYNIVKKIYNGSNWKSVSSKYDLTKYNRFDHTKEK